MQQLDVVNGVSSQSMKMNETAAERLSLRLSMESSSVVLNLRRSEFIDDQTPVYVSTHGHVVRWTTSPANQVLRRPSLHLNYYQ